MLSPKVKLHIQSIRVSHGPDHNVCLMIPQKYFYDGLHVLMDVLIWMLKVHHKHIWVLINGQKKILKIFDNHKSLSALVSKLPGTIMGLTKEPKNWKE